MFRGLGFKGLGFKGLGLKVSGFGALGVRSLGFRVRGLGLGVCTVSGLRFSLGGDFCTPHLCVYIYIDIYISHLQSYTLGAPRSKLVTVIKQHERTRGKEGGNRKALGKQLLVLTPPL